MGNMMATDSKPQKRLANIELLRILAMVLIVSNHFTGHGLKLMDYDFNGLISVFNWFIRGIGYMGTNLFILISAYFLCRSKFKTKGLLLLFAQTLYYSVLLYFISYFLGWHSMSLFEAIKVFLPITTSQYWFVSCYVALYLLFPFLNILVDELVCLGKKVFLTFLGILLLFFSIIPNLFFFSQWINWGGSSGIVWFIVLYFIGAYIRNFISIEFLKINKCKVWLWTILLWCLPLLSKLIIAYTTNAFCGHVVGSSIFYVKNSIILVPASVMTFLAFLTFDIKNAYSIRLINWVATGIFAVYLIHENNFVRDYLWNFVCERIHPNTYAIIYESFIVVGAVFFSCLFLDIVRNQIFKLISKTNFFQRHSSRIIVKVDSLMNFRLFV